eukprot:TRINITY_DN8450_c0_g1_i1.p1 TRINITY_DN8450_c0_g1~~TRINITY_DN8450_c0_g1_i1.p1  ORF type:complete len:598 (+),score=64.36 TRINITY_DN8450_c0_g1_i1:65-1858(+)
MASLDGLLPETRLHILRCVCGGAARLPAESLVALAQASSSWQRLSQAPEILPFRARLTCRLLTAGTNYKRCGEVWPPAAPLDAHRTQNSQPLGEQDFLVRFLQTCFRRRFPPTIEFQEELAEVRDLNSWLQWVRAFRDEHFSLDRGHSQLLAAGDSPAPVWCAAATILHGQRVCVVGGGCYSYEQANAQTNLVEVLWCQPAVHVFDVRTQRWAQQTVSGAPPPPAHTYATAQSLLGSRWVFWCGGYYGQVYNTAWSLDVDAWEWRPLRNSSSEMPCPRYFAAYFEYLGALFAWGGRSSQDTYCNDLWRLDRSRAHQDVIHTEEVRATGELPAARFGATLTNCDNRFAVLFGGGQWKTGGLFQSDEETFTLDFASFVWTRLQISGPRPTPRLQHSAVNLGGNLVLILGGYEAAKRKYLGMEEHSVLNVRSLQWMRLQGPQLRPGAIVELINLISRQDLNGTQGRALQFIEDRQRWQVRLDSGDMMIRAQNLRVVSQATTEVGTDAMADEEEETENSDRHIPLMLSQTFEDATGGQSWFCGRFPSARAGMALADDSGLELSSTRRSFFLFGGAQYVHQDWYADLYECVLDRDMIPTAEL